MTGHRTYGLQVPTEDKPAGEAASTHDRRAKQTELHQAGVDTFRMEVEIEGLVSSHPRPHYYILSRRIKTAICTWSELTEFSCISQARAAQEVQQLSRQLKEMWLFGRLEGRREQMEEEELESNVTVDKRIVEQIEKTLRENGQLTF